MDARSEFFVYMGASLATIVALFGAQLWYETYLDVAVVHAQQLDAPRNAAMEAARAQDEAKLAGGATPITKAMDVIAQRGRAASPKLAPLPSDDLSAMSGWIHRPGFAAYEPRKPAVIAPEPASAEPAADGAVPALVGEGVAPAQPAPATPSAPRGKVVVPARKVTATKVATGQPKSAATPAPAAAPTPASVPAAPAPATP